MIVISGWGDCAVVIMIRMMIIMIMILMMIIIMILTIMGEEEGLV